MPKPTLTATEGVALTTHAKYGRKWYPPSRIAALGNIAEADAAKALTGLVTRGLAVERTGRYALTDSGKALAATWKPDTATPVKAETPAPTKARTRRPKATPTAAPIAPLAPVEDEDESGDDEDDADEGDDAGNALDSLWNGH
jgi:hypothetical protein